MNNSKNQSPTKKKLIKFLTKIYATSLIFDQILEFPKRMFIFSILNCNTGSNKLLKFECYQSTHWLWILYSITCLIVDIAFMLISKISKCDINMYSDYILAAVEDTWNLTEAFFNLFMASVPIIDASGNARLVLISFMILTLSMGVVIAMKNIPLYKDRAS